MALPNILAVSGTTLCMAAPSRKCMCQSSGRVIVIELIMLVTFLWFIGGVIGTTLVWNWVITPWIEGVAPKKPANGKIASFEETKTFYGLHRIGGA